MSPEFYAIIGVGASLAGLMIGIGGMLLYFINQTNRRIDEQGLRMDRIEDKIDRLLEQTHALDLRVSKLEWTLEAALYGRPLIFPRDAEDGAAD